MNFWGGLLSLLKTKMPQAEPYGVFHIVCFALSIIAGIILVKKIKSPTQTQVRKLLLIVSVAVIVLEVYKQIVYCVSFDGSEFHFRYKWYVFPLQFCSTPMYIGLLGGIFKNEKFHRLCCAYLSSYAVFAGLSVMIGPYQVLTDVVGLNIQTMVCHGSMITIGIFLMCTNYVKTETRTLMQALPIFATVFTLAVVLNEIAYHAGFEQFNLFFISPHEQTVIPILSSIEKVCPAPIPQAVYFVTFSFIAWLILMLFAGIRKLTEKKQGLTIHQDILMPTEKIKTKV